MLTPCGFGSLTMGLSVRVEGAWREELSCRGEASPPSAASHLPWLGDMRVRFCVSRVRVCVRPQVCPPTCVCECVCECACIPADAGAHASAHIHVCVYLCICVCVCLCACLSVYVLGGSAESVLVLGGQHSLPGCGLPTVA